jgi:hypothetical protein
MTTPQAGIFAVGTRTHHHLEFDVERSAGVDEIAQTIGAVTESGDRNVVIGLGAELWTRLAERLAR